MFGTTGIHFFFERAESRERIPGKPFTSGFTDSLNGKFTGPLYRKVPPPAWKVQGKVYFT
jgi:hypothetical protein